MLTACLFQHLIFVWDPIFPSWSFQVALNLEEEMHIGQKSSPQRAFQTEGVACAKFSKVRMVGSYTYFQQATGGIMLVSLTRLEAPGGQGWCTFSLVVDPNHLPKSRGMDKEKAMLSYYDCQFRVTECEILGLCSGSLSPWSSSILYLFLRWIFCISSKSGPMFWHGWNPLR